jgi:hypothetical protein
MRRKWAESTLPGLEAPVRLVDDIDAALAADKPIIAVATAQGFQRITDFHGAIPYWRLIKDVACACQCRARPDED